MNKSKYIIIFLAALLAISSCTHKFDEYNRNPNQIEVGNIVPSSMMKSLIYYSADIFLNRTWLLNGELMQYTVSASNNTAYHRYTIQSGVSVAVWKDLAEWASNANEMYGLAVKEENENYQAVALTMKVLLMSNITDSFGDMPYSQAFGISGGSHQPAYDTQEEIYRQMFSELELANSLYNPGIELVPTDVDLLYGGQTAKWQKLTN